MDYSPLGHKRVRHDIANERAIPSARWKCTGRVCPRVRAAPVLPLSWLSCAEPVALFLSLELPRFCTGPEGQVPVYPEVSNIVSGSR